MQRNTKSQLLELLLKLKQSCNRQPCSSCDSPALSITLQISMMRLLDVSPTSPALLEATRLFYYHDLEGGRSYRCSRDLPNSKSQQVYSPTSRLSGTFWILLRRSNGMRYLVPTSATLLAFFSLSHHCSFCFHLLNRLPDGKSLSQYAFSTEPKLRRIKVERISVVSMLRKSQPSILVGRLPNVILF